VLIVLILFPRGLAGLCFDLRAWLVDVLTRRREAAVPGAPGPVGPALAP
jgi:hypothetical protein